MNSDFSAISKNIFYFIFLSVLALYTGCAGTDPILDQEGNIVSGSISTMEYVPIGGQKQFMLIRGEDTENPVLLFLHGGPGSPETGMVRKYHEDLEKFFTVVLWEQRGSGKSYASTKSASSLNLEQMIQDTHEITVYLKKGFKKRRSIWWVTPGVAIWESIQLPDSRRITMPLSLPVSWSTRSVRKRFLFAI